MSLSVDLTSPTLYKHIMQAINLVGHSSHLSTYTLKPASLFAARTINNLDVSRQTFNIRPYVCVLDVCMPIGTIPVNVSVGRLYTALTIVYL